MLIFCAATFGYFLHDLTIQFACAAGDAIEDVLATQGSAKHMSAQERWAEGVITRKDAAAHASTLSAL